MPPRTVAAVIFSIGHSTRPLDQFLALLRAHGIHTLVDIRSIPRSRRNPQYDQVALQQAIEADGLVYKHLPALGGHRRAREDSPNKGWLNPAFQGYADYMQTGAFEQGLCELLELNRADGPIGNHVRGSCAMALPPLDGGRCSCRARHAGRAHSGSRPHPCAPAEPDGTYRGRPSALPCRDQPSRPCQPQKVDQTAVRAEPLQQFCLVRVSRSATFFPANAPVCDGRRHHRAGRRRADQSHAAR